MSPRTIVAACILVTAGLALGLGVLWIASSYLFSNSSWATLAQNLLTIITSVATIAALSSILTLWPDLREEARRDIQNLMKEYEDLDRAKAPPYEIARVAAQIRRQVRLASFTPKEIRDFLQSPRDEERLAGLSAVQGQGLDDYRHMGDTKYHGRRINGYFIELLNVLTNPRRSFEHYQAIQAMSGILPYLNPQQTQKLCMRVMDYNGGQGTTSEKWSEFAESTVRNLCSDRESN